MARPVERTSTARAEARLPRPAAQPDRPARVAAQGAAPAALPDEVSPPVVGPVADPAADPAANPALAAAPARVASLPAETADSADWLLPVGGLAVIAALGLGGLVAARRRRPYTRAVEATEPGLPAPDPRTSAMRAAAPLASVEPVVASPAAVAPPAQPVIADDGNREAAIARMVAAAPDAANPFTSRKARRRRARLILQSEAARRAAAERTAIRPAETPVPAFRRNEDLVPA